MINKDKLDKASNYLNDKINFREVLSEFNLLDGSMETADGVNIICPFHDDKDPSLKVDLNRNLYKCFGCVDKGGGNAIHFIARYQTEVLGKKTAYSRVLDGMLKSDKDALADLGFNTVFETAPGLDDILGGALKINKIKVEKETVKTFMDLSKYLINNCTTAEKLNAIKLMQDGFDAESIFNLMFDKSKFSRSFNDVKEDIKALMESD